MNKLVEIAGIQYPKQRLLKKNNDTLKYYFELNNKAIILELKGYSPYMFLAYKNNTLILKQNDNTLYIEQDRLFYKKKKIFSIKFNKKIEQIYFLSGKRYLLSATDKVNKHYLLLLDKKFNIIKEQQIGICPWHSQNSIDQYGYTIMYAEYNVGNETVPVSIYRSEDGGYTWKNIFTLQAPNEIRHWHTLQKDPFIPNYWLATTGDTPTQSRWFLSKDNGDNWNEITDKDYINSTYKSRNLSAHRTTAIDITKENYYWTTDDLMGNAASYFLYENGERKASSKFYKSKKSKPIEIEKLTNLGIHGRSLIRINSGYIVITEAKYVTYNMQIFYIDDADLTKAYFLLSLPGTLRTGGTYSMNSLMDKNKCYLKFANKSHLLGKKYQVATLSLTEVKINKRLDYKIEQYVRFEEHLWFLNHIKSIENIHFSDNKVSIQLKKSNDVCHMLLGDALPNSLEPKELFRLPYYKKIKIHINYKREKNTTAILYIGGYSMSEKVEMKSFPLAVGDNSISYEASSSDTQFIKIQIRISNYTSDQIELSNLRLFTGI